MGISTMEVCRVRPDWPGRYFDLMPGPLDEHGFPNPNVALLYIDWSAWDLIMEPLIVGRVTDYDRHADVEVSQEVWEQVIDDLVRLQRIVKDLEYFGELYVEFGWTFRYYPNLEHAERNFAQTKKHLLFALEEIREWLSETLKTHSVITILGI